MKRFLLFISSITFLFCWFPKAQAQTQTVVNGASTTAINFTGTGCVYNWTNSTPGIGLPASGTGDIASFTAVNNGSSPISATITATPTAAGLAYIINSTDNSVSVINTMSNAVVSTIPVGVTPQGISISPDGSTAYITNSNSGTVSVINTATNTVTSSIPVGTYPIGISLSPNGNFLYVVNEDVGTVSVISTSTNTIVSTIPVGNNPWGITITPDGSTVYVANQKGGVSVINTTTNTVVSTIPIAGFNPYCITVSPDGSRVYVTNYQSATVSVINVTTDAVIATIGVDVYPVGVSVSPDGGWVYVACQNNTISVISAATNMVVSSIQTQGITPEGTSITPDGNYLYVTDLSSKNVTVISTATRAVTAIIAVGSNPTSFGNFISAGPGCSSTPITFTITVNNSAPAILPPNISYQTPQTYPVNTAITPLAPKNTGGAVPPSTYGQAVIIAGSGSTGSANGISTAASFNQPHAVAVDKAGNIYVADANNHLIRKITPAGIVSTLAGSGTAGFADGTGTGASFNFPTGIAVDAAGNVYVADQRNDAIRKITPAGVVTTLAGNGTAGSSDGTGAAARFNYPHGLAIDANGNLYVADQSNRSVREISPAGVVTTLLATGLNQPEGVTVDAAGNVYVADLGNDQIKKITPGGGVSVFAGSGSIGSNNGNGTAASFYGLYGLSIDAYGNIYVADTYNGLIRKIDPLGNVSTLGILGTYTVAIDGTGNLIAGDLGYNQIKRIAVFGYTIDKPLPPGLTFDPTTGIISGTPTMSSPATDYTVTANNAGGSNATIVNITVTAIASANITVGTITGNISSCAGTPSVSPNIQQFTVSGSGLSTNITATAPAGFEISLTSGGGYGSSVTLIESGGTINSVIVYVRSAASATGNISGNVILTSAGASPQNVAVTGTVNALPTVNAVTNQTVLNGAVTATINFTGSGNTFNWVNNTPAIGLGASGSGNIAPFTALNISGAPITATITVTPLLAGAVGGVSCSGTPITLTIEVDPTLPASISASGTLSALTTIYGIPSPSSSFSVSGANLTSGILVTSPAGFEVSTDNINFTSTVTAGTAGATTSTLVYMRLTSTTPVGSYSGNVILSSAGAINVNIQLATGTVTPAALTITTGNATKTYGIVLIGGTGSATFTAAGLKNNETIGSITITYGTGSAGTDAVGTYAGSVNGSAATGGTFMAGNYVITYIPDDIIVDKATLTVTADNKTKTYGTPNPVLTATYTGLVNNEKAAQLTNLPQLSTTATTTSPVGNYPIVLSGASSSNYTITYLPGILTIDPVKPTISIPNAFTPNGDGINDVWNIKSLSYYPQCTVSIFTRYGSLIYQSKGYPKPWDGTSNGTPLPVGTYYYIINPQNGTQALAGSVTILR